MKKKETNRKKFTNKDGFDKADTRLKKNTHSNNKL